MARPGRTASPRSKCAGRTALRHPRNGPSCHPAAGRGDRRRRPRRRRRQSPRRSSRTAPRQAGPGRLRGGGNGGQRPCFRSQGRSPLPVDPSAVDGKGLREGIWRPGPSGARRRIQEFASPEIISGKSRARQGRARRIGRFPPGPVRRREARRRSLRAAGPVQGLPGSNPAGTPRLAAGAEDRSLSIPVVAGDE